jgi:hypothetical protein
MTDEGAQGASDRTEQAGAGAISWAVCSVLDSLLRVNQQPLAVDSLRRRNAHNVFLKDCN